MNKNLFKEARLKEATFDFVFEPIPKIETRLASEFAKNLSSIFEQDYTLTKVDDAAPIMIPRFILSSRNKRVLEVSPIKATFKGNFESLKFTDALILFKNTATKIFNYLNSNETVRIEEFSFSFSMNYSLNDVNYLIKDDIFDSYFKIKKPNDLKEIDFCLIGESEDYISKTRVSCYTIRQVDAKQFESARNVVYHDFAIRRLLLSEVEIKESGIVFFYQVSNNSKTASKFSNKVELYNNLLGLTDTVFNYAESFLFGNV